MNEFSDEVKLPSLWRIKFHAFFWTVGFGAVLFVLFFVLIPPINIHFAGMQASDVRMSLVWICTIIGALVVNKVYYWWNPDVYQNNTQQIRLMRQETRQIPQLRKEVKQVYDYLVTTPEATEE